MKLQKQKGFTLVELVLFLALTGLFLLIALTGVRTRNANVQFTDSIRSLESFLQLEANKLRNGVNLYGNGDDASKIIIGTMFKLEIDTGMLKAYDLIGGRQTAAEIDKLIGDHSGQTKDESYHNYFVYDSLLKNDGNIVANSGNPRVYDLEWGSSYIYAQYGGQLNLPGRFARYFGFAISPLNSTIVPIGFQEGNPTSGSMDDSEINKAANYEPELTPTNSTPYPDAFSYHICIDGANGQRGEVSLGEGKRDLAIEAFFDSSMSEICQGI